MRGEARSTEGDEAGDREAGEELEACAGERNVDVGDDEAGKKTPRPRPGAGERKRMSGTTGTEKTPWRMGRGRGHRGRKRLPPPWSLPL